MFSKSDVKRTLNIDVAISDKMNNAIELWSDLYTEDAPWLNREGIKSLNLPSAIASELARLTTIEMKSEISGSARADYLNAQYQKIIADLRTYLEYGCAKGGLIFKPYVDGDKITVDYIQADSFIPTSFDSSGRITGAVFIDQIRRNNAIYTRLEYHSLLDTGYQIKNLAYKSYNDSGLGQQIALTAVDEWADLEPEVTILNVNVPLFAYFKVPQANTIDTKSPLGVSVYSKAVKQIEEADKQYSRLLWEFESGERALYVNETAFKKDNNGKPILPNKRLYRTLGVADEDLYEDWTPTLREQSIINGLNKILQRIEFNCNLAYGTLSDPQNVDKTAEEIKASKQRSYATVADMQKSLKTALIDLAAAMDIWCGLYNLAPKGTYETSFEFDDSLVTDRSAEFVEKQQLVATGVMQNWEFRMWYFGETEEQAKKMVRSQEEPPEE